jgi:hypothetical protein
MRVLAPALLALALLAPPAHAEDGPAGVLCGLDTKYDLRDPSRSTRVGVLTGGPVAGSGTLTCTIQLDPLHGTTANDTLARSASGVGVVAFAEPVSYQAPPYATVFLCTQFAPASGGTLYYDDHEGDWSTDPASGCQPTNLRCDCDPWLEEMACDVLRLMAPLVPDPAGPVYVSPGGDVWVGGVYLGYCGPDLG